MSIPYRWIIVAAGALMTCVALGAMFSLAIFQTPIATETGWSHTGIASAMTLNFIVMGIGGFMWGALSDRFGPRPVVMIGERLSRVMVTLSLYWPAAPLTVAEVTRMPVPLKAMDCVAAAAFK